MDPIKRMAYHAARHSEKPLYTNVPVAGSVSGEEKRYVDITVSCMKVGSWVHRLSAVALSEQLEQKLQMRIFTKNISRDAAQTD